MDNRDYSDISEYRKLLLDKVIQNIQLNYDADEGLILIFSDGSKLSFGFSGCEGIIEIS